MDVPPLGARCRAPAKYTPRRRTREGIGTSRRACLATIGAATRLTPAGGLRRRPPRGRREVPAWPTAGRTTPRPRAGRAGTSRPRGRSGPHGPGTALAPPQPRLAQVHQRPGHHAYILRAGVAHDPPKLGKDREP